MVNKKYYSTYFILILVLINSGVTHTMKRKADALEEPSETSVDNRQPPHKRARTGDGVGHQLWIDNTSNSKNTLENNLSEIITFFKNRHASDPAIAQAASIKDLLHIIEDKNDLAKCHQKLETFSDGLDGAQITIDCLSPLKETQIFTDAIHAILTNEFSKPHEQIPTAFQQALFIIERAIKDFYDKALAPHNENKTFKQVLSHHNDDLSATLNTVQCTAGNLLQRATIEPGQHRHLFDLILGRHGALSAIEAESKLNKQLKKIKEKK